MRAYKFKSAAQADHIFDILLNRRLYCADWNTLNDPMEGQFGYSTRQEHSRDLVEDLANKVRSELNVLRVCSLTSTYDSHLLWAHYANGFNGVAIGVDLPDNHPEVHKVEYRGVFGFYNYSPDIDHIKQSAELLSSKYQEWSYEREIRILSKDMWFKLNNPVARVIIGHRVHPALFDAIQIICEKENIEFTSVGIGDEGIDADRVLPYAERIARRK